MNISEALALAEQYKKDGVISTSGKALIALADAWTKLMGNRDAWIKAKPGWYVHDYGDGWIYFEDEAEARKCSEEHGDSAIRQVKDGVCKDV